MNIKDIAQEAGVSVSTVSKVINHKDKDISEITRSKVLAVVEKYNYRPYTEVINRQVEHSHLVAVIASRKNARHQQLLESLEQELSKYQLNLMVVLANNDFERQVGVIVQQHVEAAIVLDVSEAKEWSCALESNAIPCVGLFTDDVGVVSGFHYDLGLLACKLLEYLSTQGHHNFLCLGAHVGAAWIYAAKHYALENSLTCEVICEADLGQAEPSLWLPDKCSAVITEDVLQAGKLCSLFSRYGIRVPTDISVASLWDDAYAKLLSPAVTTMATAWQNIAAKLTQLVQDQISGKPVSVLGIVEQNCHVLVRQSTEPLEYNRLRHRLVVVGSMNMDVNISIPKIPTGDETLIASSVTLLPGGKGANQAVGAAKLGADVYLIGSIGTDATSRELYASLKDNNVHTSGVLVDTTLDTGKAYINVADNGDSNILIYPGANSHLSAEHIRSCQRLFPKARFCLLSTEVPLEAVEATLKECQKNHVAVMLKPAGIEKFPRNLYQGIDYFIPNERELNLLIPSDESLETKAAELLKLGVENVIVTMGSQGCYVRNAQRAGYFPAAGFTAVDATGGADAFISALAVYLSDGLDLQRAIGYASYSAGICVSGHGVQNVMATRDKLDVFRDEIEKKYILN